MERKGLLIAIEGLDRSGKSTQAHLLEENGCVVVRFPDRSTESGKCIDHILKNKQHMDNQELTALFKVNRKEKQYLIENLLNEGKVVVLDRYMFSGQAYEFARIQEAGSEQEKASEEWLVHEDIPQPQLVFFLETPIAIIQQRKEFGKEIFEKKTFQEKVREGYAKIMRFNQHLKWQVLDGTQDPLVIHKQIRETIARSA